MFCKQCGAQVPDGASFCTQCGCPQSEQVQPFPQAMNAQNQPFSQAQMNTTQYVQIETYLVHNILATLFCCPLLGIVGLIFSILAKNALSNGNIQAAKSNAGTAKVLFWISLGIGLLCIPLLLAMLGAGAAAAGV